MVSGASRARTARGAARVAHGQGPHRHLSRGPARRSPASQTGTLLLDGEVVAFDGDQTSFSRLQQRLGVRNPSPELVAAYPVVFCVFDLLELDGDDLRDRPLLERRARLTEAIRPSAALQLSEAWRDDSQRRFAQACRAGWEGLIAKRAQAPYVAGRSTGLAEAQMRLGAGVRDRRLHRSRPGAGPTSARCSWGITRTGSSDTPARSGPGTPRRRSATSALGCASWRCPSRRSSMRDRSPAGTHWTRPELVAQIGFAEWTNDGRLRQPRFLGLRDDKRPAEVVRERPR